jgi:type IV secretory pathway TrbF-like protein
MRAASFPLTSTWNPSRGPLGWTVTARIQARNRRLIAFGNLVLAAGLASGLIWQAARGTVTPWVVEVDKLGEARAISTAVADYRPTDPQIAWHLARFIENVRAIPADPMGAQSCLSDNQVRTRRALPASKTRLITIGVASSWRLRSRPRSASVPS